MLHEGEAYEQPATDTATPFIGGATHRNVEMITARRLWADSFLENINTNRPAAAMWQVVPANSDGSKRPFGEWKKYQDPQVRMQEAEFEQILTQTGDAIGVVTGRASNALLIELEGRAVADGAFELLSDVANASGTDELWQRFVNGLAIDTPSGGVHLWVSCIDEGYEYPPNQPLARNEAGEVLAETRGEGGFAIVAPSYGRKGHPEGSRYEFKTRADGTKCQPADAAIVTGAEIATLLDFVRNVLSTQAELEPDRSPVHKGDTDRLRPGDDFNARADFAQLLTEEGWSLVHSAGERDFYRRPNKGEGVSGNLKANVFYNHSTSVGNLPAGKAFTPFTFYTHTKHGGDYKAAAKALALGGYGDPLHVEVEETPQPFVPEVKEPEHRPRGAELLDEIEAILRRYAYLQHDWHYAAITLWIAGTYFMSAFEYVSRLILVSPQPRCGKSRVLELIESLAYRGFMTSSVSGAYLVRKLNNLDEHRMTLMIDEADTVLSRRHDDNATLDNVLNSGFKSTGVYSRCEEVKGTYVERDFCTYAAVAIASIRTKHFRKATLDRAVIVEMQRRLKTETVERLRGRQRSELVAPYGRALFEWSRGLLPKMTQPDFAELIELPPTVEDRHADILEPLIAIANEAGGFWPERARLVALQVAENQPQSDTAAAKLIALMVTLANGLGEGFLPTRTLVEVLNKDGQYQATLSEVEESEPIDPEVLQLVRNSAGKITAAEIAQTLGDFGLRPKHRSTGRRDRGYRLDELKAAHERYPVAPPE
jgi:hypothetical protein